MNFRLQCLHCGSERFHLQIKNDGSTEIICVSHADHLAEFGIGRETTEENDG